jgi:ABC-type transport system involved in multi-copper enzyme maturation permease subunit
MAMPARWGLGPVFAAEWLTASRRWQTYALRSLVAGVLFAAVAVVWAAKAEPLARRGPMDRNAHAQVGEALFYGFFGTLLTATLLAAPGATAGAVCLDKARGTLLHLLVTDLSSAEIVLGKLAARLLPLAGLLACSVPVQSLCLWLGGIEPDAMLVAYAVTAGVAVLGSALAFLLSVWGHKTYEVLLAAYLVEVLLLLAYPVALGLDGLWRQAVLAPYVSWTNPFLLAFSPYLYRGAADPTDLTIFLSVCLGAAATCALLAVVTVRPVTVRQSGRPQRPRRQRLKGLRLPRLWAPRLDPNPVLWREWHRQRPSRWAQWVWAVYAVGALAGTGMVIYWRCTGHTDSGFAAFTTGLQASVGLLLASVAAVTSLAEERVRGSLDVLLTTPLPTRTIVWGKWRGAFRLVPWLALLPVVNVLAVAQSEVSRVAPAAGPAMTPGVTRVPAAMHVAWTAAPLMFALMLAYGAAVTSLGLACATWIRRLGRAVAASVVVYALVTAGWLALVSAVSHGQEFEAPAMGSPFFGAGELAFESSSSHRLRPDGMLECYGPLAFWIAFYAAAALLLYLAVLGTFNRCLGRVPERARRRRSLAA